MISVKSVLLAYSFYLADAMAISAARVSATAVTLFLLRQPVLSSLCRSCRNLTSKFGSGFTPAFAALSIALVIYVSSFFDNIWWVLIYENGVVIDIFPE